MKQIAKYIFLFLIYVSILDAKSFYINEPIFNAKVFVQTYGNENKQPVVFIHGLGDEASSIWNDSINKLKDDYYILTFDLPGFGKSTKDNKEYSPSNYVLLIDYITSKYINKPFLLIGHSMGAAISLKYAATYPSTIKRLFMMDVAGILHKDAYSKFIVKMGLSKFFSLKSFEIINEKITTFFTKINDIFSKIMPNDSSSIFSSQESRELYFQGKPSTIAAVALIMEDYSKILEKIKIPTLLLWGEDDEIAPLRTGYILNKMIGNSTLKVIKNSGHLPMLDSKKEYLKYLELFAKNKVKKSISKVYEKKFDNIVIENQNDIKLEGQYKTITINNSRNIVLNNCYANKIIISKSRVSINNSKIISLLTAFDISYSEVYLTASDIIGKETIKTQSSRLDIAGCFIQGEDYSFLNSNNKHNNHITFSVTEIDNKLNKNKFFHKKVVLVSNNKI